MKINMYMYVQYTYMKFKTNLFIDSKCNDLTFPQAPNGFLDFSKRNPETILFTDTVKDMFSKISKDFF